MRAFHCSGFSCFGSQALGLQTSVGAACGFSSYGSRALECWLNSCGTRASLPHNMWDLPGPGIKPVSLTLLGGFLTTGPPGKPLPASLVPAHLISLLCTSKRLGRQPWALSLPDKELCLREREVGSKLSIRPQPQPPMVGLFVQGDGLLMEVMSFLCASPHPPGLLAGPFSCLNQDISVRSDR